jgi:hypothetical protein
LTQNVIALQRATARIAEYALVTAVQAGQGGVVQITRFWRLFPALAAREAA